MSEHPSTVNLLKGSNHLYNLHEIFASLRGEMIWKISLLLKFKIIGVFVNTRTADYKYPVSDSENLGFFIQMQLS